MQPLSGGPAGVNILRQTPFASNSRAPAPPCFEICPQTWLYRVKIEALPSQIVATGCKGRFLLISHASGFEYSWAPFRNSWLGLAPILFLSGVEGLPDKFAGVSGRRSLSPRLVRVLHLHGCRAPTLWKGLISSTSIQL